MSRMSNSIFNRLKISLSSGFKFVFINAVGATSLAAILTLLFKLDTPFLIGSNTEMLPAFAFIIGTFVGFFVCG